MDELQLMRDAAANANAFAELYLLHVARVYRYHMAHTDDVHEAEELTSQTFMTAVESLHMFRGDDSFAAWIMGIATQKRSRNIRGSRRELPSDAVLYYQGSGLPTDRSAMQRMEIESISRALKQIPVDRAEATILYFFGNLSSSEISSVLKKNTATTEQLIARGLHDLSTRTTEKDAGQNNSQLEDAELPDKLTNIAYKLMPDPLFISELEQALLAKHVPKKARATLPLQQIASFTGWLALVALGVFLLNWRVEPPPAAKKPTATVQTVVLAKGSPVPSTPKPSPTPRATNTRIPTQEYIVQAGDTCTFIATRFNVTIDQLIFFNRLNSSCDIWVDQKLTIPIIATTP
jgi:RNA polymerase sigma-70 factor (ECF subfamily)